MSSAHMVGSGLDHVRVTETPTCYLIELDIGTFTERALRVDLYDRLLMVHGDHDDVAEAARSRSGSTSCSRSRSGFRRTSTAGCPRLLPARLGWSSSPSRPLLFPAPAADRAGDRVLRSRRAR